MGRGSARGLLAGILVVVLCLPGCGGGGSSALDLDGVYRWVVTFTQPGCGGAVGEVRSQNVTVRHDGKEVTFLIPADAGRANVPISGELEGERVRATGTYQNPPWGLILDIDAAVGNGGASLTGTMVFTWVNTSDRASCVDRASFAATRV